MIKRRNVSDDNVKKETTDDASTIVLVNGQKYVMVDVAADGNCFYSSLLQNEKFYKKFKTVKRMRNSLRRCVKKWYDKDCLIRKMFQVEDTKVKAWMETIGRKGTWATSLEMMLITYCTGVDIYIIGNYINGFVKIKISKQIRQLTHTTITLKRREPIMLYLHQKGRADVPTHNPNHFSYLRKKRSGSDNIEESNREQLHNNRENMMKDDDSKLGMVVYVEKVFLSGSFLSSDEDSENSDSDSFMNDHRNDNKSTDNISLCDTENIMENIVGRNQAYVTNLTSFQEFEEMFGLQNSGESEVE